MASILVLQDAPSVLVSSISEQLRGLGHKVTSSSLLVREINAVKEKQDMFLIFADEDLSDNTEALVYLKDKAVEDDVIIYAMGDTSELDILKKTIPAVLIKKTFSRPINVKDVVESVDAYLKDEKRLNKKKILVVDDSGAMLRNVKGWLEDRYQIILANSGTMAIKYLSNDKPDLILLDYEMPVLSGKQVLEMIRSEMEFADIPVIFLTSKGDRQSVLDVMSLKPEGYLLKTMPPQDIIKTVDDFFVRKKIEKQNS